MLNFSYSKLKSHHKGAWLILDLVMPGLLIINLIWLLFDGLLATQGCRNCRDTQCAEINR
ncbi:hypothetical protein CXF95_08850 [Paraglaciecola sp. MB-3u-78]|nr:hypothetical protein CXF95_08850 [Paraglaciecola sp. MB-3u-78]